MSVAKLLSKKSHIVPGPFLLTEYHFQVPLHHHQPSNLPTSIPSSSLRLFARTIEPPSLNITPTPQAQPTKWLAFLQGGPGIGCRPPTPQYYPWVKSVLERGYRVLFLDQRGTGLSTTVTAAGLGKVGGVREQVGYLKKFRADSIVQDLESIRNLLLPDQKWSLLGQSFGGFIALTYLSFHPSSLLEVFISGGLAPLVSHPDPVYSALLSKCHDRSLAFYAKYPEDVHRVKQIIEHVGSKEVRTPTGGKVTAMRIRQLGLHFGLHGGLDTVHDMILRFCNDLEMFGAFTRPTLSAFESLFPFNNSILYALLHEPIYCQHAAANWSAERMMSQRPEFQYPRENKEDPILFTSEMIFKPMYEDYDELIPLKETANRMATESDWPALYDEEQLGRNEVPVYAMTYYKDLYVDFELAQETARKVKGCKQVITNMMYHDALGAKSEEVMKGLFALRDDVID